MSFLLLGSVATQTGAPTLGEQLEAQDRLVKMGTDTGGYSVLVAMGIVACDTCNNTDLPTWDKANGEFQFPKGALAKAERRRWENTIGQLLAISDASQQQGSPQSGPQKRGGQDQGGQPQQAQAEPIQMG